jgi:hypothetical protein
LICHQHCRLFLVPPFQGADNAFLFLLPFRAEVLTVSTNVDPFSVLSWSDREELFCGLPLAYLDYFWLWLEVVLHLWLCILCIWITMRSPSFVPQSHIRCLFFCLWIACVDYIGFCVKTFADRGMRISREWIEVHSSSVTGWSTWRSLFFVL